MYSAPLAVAFDKSGFHDYELVNSMIIRVFNADLVERFWAPLYGAKVPENSNFAPTLDVRAVSINLIRPAFHMLLCGYWLAFIAIFCELWYKFRRKIYKKLLRVYYWLSSGNGKKNRRGTSVRNRDLPITTHKNSIYSRTSSVINWQQQQQDSGMRARVSSFLSGDVLPPVILNKRQQKLMRNSWYKS